MVMLENWIVGFVFAELVALALVIALSCWCCRRSTRRAHEEEEAHALPMTAVTRQKAPSRAIATGQHQDPDATTHPGDLSDDGDDSHDDEEYGNAAHDDDGIVSGGLWGFVVGYPPPDNKKITAKQSSRDVEVVNLSVNTVVMVDEDEEKEDGGEKSEPGAAAIDKSGSAA